MPIVASAIDTANHAGYGFNGLFTLRVPLWSSGGALYAAGTINHDSPTVEAAAVWKSIDDGASWTLQDGANAPDQTASLANCIDGPLVHFLAGPRSDQTDLALRIYTFDCSTDTWALVDNAGPTAHFASGLAKRSDGSFVAVYGTFGANDLWAVSFNGSWGTPADIGGVTGPNLVSFDVWSCIDEEDRAHVFLHDQDPIFFTYDNWWHVAIETDDSIGSVDALPTLGVFGGAEAVGVNIALACSIGGELKVLVGTPLAAPVFTASAAIDTTNPDATNLIYDPAAGTFVVVSLHTSQSIFLMSQSYDLVTWAAPTQLYDTATDTLPPDFSSGGIFPAGLWYAAGDDMILLGSNYQNSSISFFTAFYIGAFPFTPAPPTFVYHNTFE